MHGKFGRARDRVFLATVVTMSRAGFNSDKFITTP